MQKHKKATSNILDLIIDICKNPDATLTGDGKIKILKRIDSIIDEAVKKNVLLHNVSNCLCTTDETIGWSEEKVCSTCSKIIKQ